MGRAVVRATGLREPMEIPSNNLRRAVCVAALALACGCSYLRYASVQAEYERLQEVAPSQRNLKHMIERPNFSVIGRLMDPAGLHGAAGKTVAIAAFSSRFRRDELVDVMQGIEVGTHFGLNLPEGEFELLALTDLDGDGVYRNDEVVGRMALTLSKDETPSMVRNRLVVERAPVATVPWTIDIAVERTGEREPSLFFPAGTIRDLCDPIFSDEMITLGLYDPATFFERAPTLFYALEDDLSYKVPVIFVHGSSGSARGFEAMVARVDRSRFKPWFFHYPSGGDLDQLGELFYDIFLSGEAIAPNEFVPIVIVAHSMGGLVVRKALSRLRGRAREPASIEFISLATPFGGHPSARGIGDIGLMILPSWRDLDPDGAFLRDLYDRPLPANVRHHLFHAFDNEALVKFGENSDGVVPLSSQLHPAAQRQASHQLGIATTHVGIQREQAGIDAVMQVLDGIEARIPAKHMASLRAGGFDVVGDYSEMERYILRHYGRFLEGLASGDLEPLDADQRRLVPMLRGEAEPTLSAAVTWRKFLANERRQRSR